MLNITINEQEGRLVATLNGDFDNVASSQAELDLAPLFEHDDCDIVFECSELNYISSSGLRLLLNVFKHARSHGHQTVLKALKEHVEEVFDLSGFLQIFKVEK